MRFFSDTKKYDNTLRIYEEDKGWTGYEICQPFVNNRTFGFEKCFKFKNAEELLKSICLSFSSNYIGMIYNVQQSRISKIKA